MKTILKLSVLLPAVLALSWAAAAEQPGVKFCKMEDVHVGMKGVGRTTIKGSQVQEFQFEVIGILKKVFPNQDIILAKLSGLDLEKTGVPYGMSGSPLYVDGQLLGAVAYAWAFSKEPICGVTPAEQMCRLISEGAAEPKPDVQGVQAPGGQGGGFEIGWAAKAWSSPAFKPASAGSISASTGGPGSISLTRLRAPLVISGCPQPVFEHYAKQFERMGLLPVQGGGAGADAAALDLAPGTPVAIPFIGGDVSVAGIGTVTERVGNDVIAFGHPMMEMGRMELPMATAEVAAIIPSQSFSFKMGSVGKTVGTLLVDRSEGIYGRIGLTPHTVPVKVVVNRADFPGQITHNYRLADSLQITPQLLGMSLFSSVFTKGNLPAENTIDYQVKIVTEDGDTIVQRAMLSSGGPTGVWSFFDAVAGTAQLLMNNPFKKARLKEVEAELNVRLGARAAAIDSVRLANVNVPPGKSAKLIVRLMRYRQQYENVELEVPVPADLPEGQYTLQVSDANGAQQMDRMAAPSAFDPRDYAEMLEMLRLQYPRQDLYVRVAVPGTGVAVQGKALPNLPASALSVLTPVGRSKTEFIGKVLKASKTTQYQILGNQSVEMVVEKEQH